MTKNETFIGRQPILDSALNVVAYELLFRSGNVTTSGVTDDLLATSTVIINTISQFGLDAVLGDHDGLVNVSHELLMSDMLELLPKDRVILEILETVEIDDAVIARCQELKAKGFRLALDDFEYRPVYEPLFDIVDVIKFDVMLSTQEAIESTLQVLKRWPKIILLAEKVEDQAQYDQCKKWGFNLYQGYFFARPSIISGKKADPNQMALMRIIGLLMTEAENTDIESVIKTSPALTLGLLRLVNSVSLGLKHKVGTLKQAMAVLGRNQLRQWAQLLLYTNNSGGDMPSPLMLMAATRGKAMELLCKSHGNTRYHSHEVVDRAFMAGVLSLVDVVLSMPMNEILDQLGLVDEIRRAILLHEGFLGELLKLQVILEGDDFAAIPALLTQTGVTTACLNQARVEAMRWANTLGTETEEDH